MSYLGVPRPVFSGRFQADPSTVNNDPEHFNAGRSARLPVALGPNMNPPNGWWNPDGSGAWRFYGCTVQRVYYGDGSWCDNKAEDPIVGASLASNEGRRRGEARQPRPRAADGLDDLRPVASRRRRWDARLPRRLTGPPPSPTSGPDSPRASPTRSLAFYQSVLESVAWVGAEDSRFLGTLAAIGATGELSIKFNVDGFQDDSTSTDFTFGRVVGAIGVHGAGEPSQFVAARYLNPGPGSSPTLSLNTAYAEVVGDVVTVNLGNSLPTTSVGGPFPSMGTLALAFLAAEPTAKPQYIGEIPYANAGWYTATAGIVSMRNPADLLPLAGNTPIALLQPAVQTFVPYNPMLVEAPDGSWLRADDFVFRLDPGTVGKTTFYARQFGQPWKGAPIALAYDATSMKGQITQGPLPGPSPVGQPRTALTFPASLTTKTDGTVELTLTATDPGNLRGYIDGQVYGITYASGNTPPLGTRAGQQPDAQRPGLLGLPGDRESHLAAQDVQPIFQQYADLYPVMKPFIDLGDFGAVARMRKLLRNVFAAPITDANAMPVTRDLSAAKRAMLLAWLDRPRYMHIETAEDLQAALQVAIELEHSTIPPYLTAYYSIKPGANAEVAQLIYSVVIEEMFHMASRSAT